MVHAGVQALAGLAGCGGQQLLFCWARVPTNAVPNGVTPSAKVGGSSQCVATVPRRAKVGRRLLYPAAWSSSRSFPVGAPLQLILPREPLGRDPPFEKLRGRCKDASCSTRPRG